MKRHSNQLLLSASDPMRFVGCRHAITLDLACFQGPAPRPRGDTEDAELPQKHGDAHEAAYLGKLKAADCSLVEIPRDSLSQAAETTRRELSEGPGTIFQGAFLSGRWGGWSDFLERVEMPSSLGNFSYESPTPS